MTKQRILFIDDKVPLCEETVGTLTQSGLDADYTFSPLEAIPRIAADEFALVIVTLIIPEMGAFEFIRRLRGLGCDVPTILLTEYGTEQSAIEAARLGFADYLAKPIENLELIARVKRVLREHAAADATTPGNLDRLLSVDPKMKAVFDRVQTIAPTESRVLILGETGCGKQLIAQAIHQESPRAKQPFVEINCAAIPENLLESEFFGHEPGAFTGASQRRIGRFEAAGEGTVFLDEIGEMSFELQSKLLHVLDSGRFSRVGSGQDLQNRARLIAATNRDLLHEVELGRFRADLYYRLNVISIELPPLRDRRGDISLLAQHFMESFMPEGSAVPQFTPAAMETLTRYPWPGNVRELRNVTEQLAVLAMGSRIEVTDLPKRILEQSFPSNASAGRFIQPLPFREARDQFERDYLKNVIEQANGNLAAGARTAGMDRAQFYRMAKRHGLIDSAGD